MNTIKTSTNTENIINNIQPHAKKEDGTFKKEEIGAECPLCHKMLVTTPFGYGCSGYKKDKSGCNFTLSNEFSGLELTKELAAKFITEKKLENCAFVSKTKKAFTADLRLNDDGTVDFIFPKKEESNLLCPACAKKLKKNQFSLACDCGYKINHTIAGRTLTEEEMRRLLEKGYIGPLDGFTSKKKKPFSASLLVNNKGEIQFEFN